MERYQHYLQEAKKWCDDLSNWENEVIDPALIKNWEEQIEKIDEWLSGPLNETECYKVEKEVRALAQEWQQFHEKLFTDCDSEGQENRVEQVPIGGHRLPPLPYPYNALEPYIDEPTMRLHHDKHHQSYVDGLNKAERELAKARKVNDFQLVKHWERELAFNGAGHYLHSIFWKVMCPQGGGKPSRELEREMSRSFGSFAEFKNQFSQAAQHVEGGGWAILVWAPQAQRMEILQAEKHQNLSQWDIVPLLVLDVWEHAYYLKYKNKRADYIENWWNVVCWDEVSRRFREARHR
ncbi:superoxide dismutase [Bacillus sp. B190/17]|uniref:superoxide dismutase n=1 Tax=Bacillus lumedeiriae TaxID=3058829 RepID=A0ABW8I5L2_9BACI